jgi:hypothetical protein
MRFGLTVVLLSVALSLSVAANARAQDRWRVDFENGAAISGYNDARIPGNTGTLFSFTDDLASDNVGAVPLVNFKFERRLGARATFLLEGDALAAPQGRAEDIFAGILVHAGKQWSIKAGYRFLEGGADNDEVYAFALVHYVAAGVVVRF